jgi:tryptophan synthase beta chain
MRNFYLGDSELPKQWYNILADLPEPLEPYLDPATRQPITPDKLTPIFPMALIEQEVSNKKWFDIPGEVLDIYRLWRPTPLRRATRLEEYLKTPAKIFFKDESVSPPGSHKPNTSIPQAYYNKKEGVKRLATETGAGQWGSSLSFACNLFDMECTVYMVKVSYDQKPYRRIMMETWGGKVIPSPSPLTNSGRHVLEKDPNSPGSLGGAISEAVEDAATHGDTHYALGSVLNHVLLHQTIVGQEAQSQMKAAGLYPDVVIACVGGGSNFGGIAFPFLKDKFEGTKKNTRFVAVEPASCPTLTKGKFEYDFGDEAGLTPLIKMYTLGHDFIPPSIHAGGLRYHGDSAIVSYLANKKFIDAVSYEQTKVFEAALIFSRTEGIIPAPETAHAIRAAIDEAVKAREEKKEINILFNLSGHGYFDLSAYDAYLRGDLKD